MEGNKRLGIERASRVANLVSCVQRARPFARRPPTSSGVRNKTASDNPKPSFMPPPPPPISPLNPRRVIVVPTTPDDAIVGFVRTTPTLNPPIVSAASAGRGAHPPNA